MCSRSVTLCEIVNDCYATAMLGGCGGEYSCGKVYWVRGQVSGWIGASMCVYGRVGGRKRVFAITNKHHVEASFEASSLQFRSL
jgi:hypothetical protein